MIAISTIEVAYLGGLTNTFYIYNDLTQTFTPKTAPNVKRPSTSLVQITLKDGRDVIMSTGYYKSDTVQIYDLENDSWTVKDEFKLPRELGVPVAVVFNDR